MTKIIDLFAWQMAKERIHPAQLTSKQIELRHEFYGDRWVKAERDLRELDAMAEWIAEQYEAQYHEPV